MRVVPIIVVFILISELAFSAHSFEECRNGYNYVQYRTDHSHIEAILTKWDKTLQKNITVMFNESQLELETMEIKDLVYNQKTTCENGKEVGKVLVEYSQSRKIRFSLKNGNGFDDDFYYLTKDKKAIETYVICEGFSTGYIACD